MSNLETCEGIVDCGFNLYTLLPLARYNVMLHDLVVTYCVSMYYL